MSDTKRVWLFEEGNATMRDELGGKGANLCEMSNIGLPVPPGFTITTDTCNEYTKNGGHFPDGLMDEIKAALAAVEDEDRQEAGRCRRIRCWSRSGRAPSSPCPA